MKQWYYSEANEQRGPVSEAELKQLLESHAIPPAALVWSENLSGWVPANSLAEFTPSPYAAPAAEPEAGHDWSGFVPSGPQVRPWIRYWARTLDFLLFTVIVGFFLGVIFPEFLEISDVLLGMILLVAYVFVEPIMLATFGTTPMKALFRVRVRNNDGSRLSFPAALVRMLKVWLRGLGLGIPLISLFTHLTSYNRLTREGITTWDAEGGFTVSHQTVAWWRWLLVVAIIVGFIYLMILGSEA